MDLLKEQKKLWNMKVVVIPITVGATGTTLKNLQKRMVEFEIQERIETIQMTALLRLVWIHRRVKGKLRVL